ncbi:MAG: hypothetical protein ACYDBT_15195 [Desulfobulbaceae bacterium]
MIMQRTRGYLPEIQQNTAVTVGLAAWAKPAKMNRNSEKNNGFDFLLTKGLRAYKFV